MWTRRSVLIMMMVNEMNSRREFHPFLSTRIQASLFPGKIRLSPTVLVFLKKQRSVWSRFPHDSLVSTSRRSLSMFWRRWHRFEHSSLLIEHFRLNLSLLSSRLTISLPNVQSSNSSSTYLFFPFTSQRRVKSSYLFSMRRRSEEKFIRLLPSSGSAIDRSTP